MDSNNMTLKNGEEYTLTQFFSTNDRKIIIPDFQRDYCWGDKTHGKNQTDIVSNFLDTLIEEMDSDVLLGKIDVYENPTNHIYLTDGQQRLTTLYLIIGMLHKEIQQDGLKKCLISDFEETHDDKEPYLQYAIRESTIFFLRDLVNEFFIKKNTLKVIEIKKQSWYFDEYDFDPTIISMLAALQMIESKLKTLSNKDKFADFVINKVKIQYYDVQERKYGEERFVIINTTGKNLTVSENLKPILLGGLEDDIYAKQWEDRETFFWKKRNKSKEVIADHGVNDFLTWCFQIDKKEESFDIIKESKELLKNDNNKAFLERVNTLFERLIILINSLKNEEIQKQFKFINGNNEAKDFLALRNLSKDKQQKNILFPLLVFIEHISTEEDDICQFLRRLRKNYFDNILEERKGNYVDWRYILQIIENSKSVQDVLMFSSLDSKITPITKNQWYNVEEQLKTVLNQHKYRLENWEDDKDFMGDLSFLFKTAKLGLSSTTIPELHINDNFDIAELERIFNNYQKTIGLLRNSEDAKKEPKLTNLFRLFRIFIECNKVGHIRRASRDFEGVLFSTLNRNHLNKNEFMNLLNSNDLKHYCEKFVKEKIKEQMIFDLSEFRVDKFIKGWLTLKVFHANQENELLSFYDGNETGVAAYREKDENKLMKDEIFDWSNSICGYGVRSGFGGGNYVHYTGEGHWLKQYALDTPFSNISFRETDRTLEEIEENRKTITDIRSLIES